MRKRFVSLLCSGLLAAGCTASSRHPAAAPTHRIPGPSAARTPTRSPATVTRNGLVLVADVTAPVARWKPVLFVPFGHRREQLGFMDYPEGLDSQPSCFAVAPDGTIWIGDRWKFRMAHYSREGRYLGAVPIHPGNSDYRIHDAVFVGDELFVTTFYQGGALTRIDPDGTAHQMTVTSDGQALAIESLYDTPGGLVSTTPGYSAKLLSPGGGNEGPFGYVAIDGTTGAARLLEGLPMAGGTTFTLEDTGDARYAATTRSASVVSVQPIRVVLRALIAGRSKAVEAVGGAQNIIAAGEDLAMYFMISSTRPTVPAFSGGRWFLEIGRSPLVWERLPNPPIPDEPETRHIALDPDGAIYLMLESSKGVEILRRP
jgi:hypothetical protein